MELNLMKRSINIPPSKHRLTTIAEKSMKTSLTADIRRNKAMKLIV